MTAILQAAAHVLARHGAHRFTMARLAERAGVSVGSLYQYFTNKEAILFRRQTDEWKKIGTLLRDILADGSTPPYARLRQAVHAFFRFECDEANLRVALGDAAPLYREAEEVRAECEAGGRRILLFMCEALPSAKAKDLALAADLFANALGAIGKQVSEQGRSRAEIDRLAAALGDMSCAWLDRLSGGAEVTVQRPAA